MTQNDDPKPEAPPPAERPTNPYARPSAYPPMQGARMLIGGRYPSRAQVAAGVPKPRLIAQPTAAPAPSAGGSILSGSALPVGRPASPNLSAPPVAPTTIAPPPVEPAPRPPEPAPPPTAAESEPSPFAVSPVEVTAPMAAEGVLARASAPRRGGSRIPAIAAGVIAVAGLGVLLAVTRPASRPTPPAPALPTQAPPAQTLTTQSSAPAAATPPAAPLPASAPAEAAATAPAPKTAARPRRTLAAHSTSAAPATATATAGVPAAASAAEPPPVISVPPAVQAPTVQAPTTQAPAGPPPRPAVRPPSDPNAPISTHTPDAG